MNKPHSIETLTAVAIVVEQVRDAHILRSLLNEKQSRASRFFAGQGRLSVISLARNILVQEPTSVVLVVDSDGADVDKLQRELSSLLESVSSAARHCIVVFNPSLEKITANAGLGPNDAISEEKKRELRRHPQVEVFLRRLTQFQTASEEDAQQCLVQTHVG